ncbi:Hypothetical_protein [Hexamita inflata]|uniref:Hypothetical_protein n=1 Tax=Hexamita inflata TaxID=28002 RepID=A0AA86QMR8_9EUKA|nr:Hypothetical protein HINF_LOCUS50166 [Hexamita inflata]
MRAMGKYAALLFKVWMKTILNYSIKNITSMTTQMPQNNSLKIKISKLSSKFRVAVATIDKFSDTAKHNQTILAQIIRSNNGKFQNSKNTKELQNKKKGRK